LIATTLNRIMAGLMGHLVSLNNLNPVDRVARPHQTHDIFSDVKSDVEPIVQDLATSLSVMQIRDHVTVLLKPHSERPEDLDHCRIQSPSGRRLKHSPCCPATGWMMTPRCATSLNEREGGVLLLSPTELMQHMHSSPRYVPISQQGHCSFGPEAAILLAWHQRPPRGKVPRV
jgi:hypothetical protein